MHWLIVVRQWAIQQGMDPSDLRVLDAFGWSGEQRSDVEGGIASIEVLELIVMKERKGLSSRIADQLSEEVDREQALMFGRRVKGVLGLMEPMVSQSPWMRILRITFIRRVLQVLDVSNPPATKPPRALRIRAVADYFFSLAATEFHRVGREATGRTTQSFESLVAEAQWQTQTEGLRWGHLEGDIHEGPFHATVMVVDPNRFQVEVVERQAECAREESLEASAQRLKLPAAVSGGFFLYSEPDILPPSLRFDPVGLLVRNGQILSPPCFGRTAFVQRKSGMCDIIPFGLNGLLVECEGHRIEVDDVHWRALTRVHGETVCSNYFQVSIVAGQVVAISESGVLDVPLNGLVLLGVQSARLPWRVGSRVKFLWRDEADPVENAVAGGPDLMLQGGIDLVADGFVGTAPPRTFSGDETGDCNLLPRMAVGLNADRHVVFAAVDGRNFDQSLGVTLAGMSELMTALGCHKAMNLDGGSSKRMVIGGVVRDLPATEIVGGQFQAVGVRPVRTALYWRPRHLV